MLRDGRRAPQPPAVHRAGAALAWMGAMRGGRRSPASSPCVMMMPPTMRVLTPQLQAGQVCVCVCVGMVGGGPARGTANAACKPYTPATDQHPSPRLANTCGTQRAQRHDRPPCNVCRPRPSTPRRDAHLDWCTYCSCPASSRYRVPKARAKLSPRLWLVPACRQGGAGAANGEAVVGGETEGISGVGAAHMQRPGEAPPHPMHWDPRPCSHAHGPRQPGEHPGALPAALRPPPLPTCSARRSPIMASIV